MKIALICSEFNKDLVLKLHEQVEKQVIDVNHLLLNLNKGIEIPEEYRGWIDGLNKIEIETHWVPGAGEIPLMTKWLLDSPNKPDGVLTLGVIVRGETTHYDSLCRILEASLWDLQKQYSWPVVFSVLMVENRKQATVRIDEKKRAMETCRALLKMMAIKKGLK